jgi:hypothetical protein
MPEGKCSSLGAQGRWLMCGTMGAYDDVVVMPLCGRVRTIDRCIHHLVAAHFGPAASVETPP